MFFNIDDSEIKNEINDYKLGNEDKFKLIVEKITPFVYNYPRVVFRASDDTCSDFYEYILIRLKSILKSYSVSAPKFTTWFTIVLRNRYLNFLREMAGQSDENHAISFDRILDSESHDGVNLHMVIADNKNYAIQSNDKRVDHILDRIISLLNDRYRVLFHLYYIDLIRVEDIRFLSIFFNKEIKEIVSGIEKIKGTIVNKYEKKEVILNRLAKNYRSIINSQKSMDKKLENNAKECQKNLLNEYRAVKCFPTYESIASFCSFPIGTVSAGIARIKFKIKSIEDDLKAIIR